MIPCFLMIYEFQLPMKKLFFRFCIIITLGSFPILASAQIKVDSVTSIIPGPLSQQIGVRFNSIAFFKNNEYFHPLVEGYTLPGFQLQPRLYYEADDKFSLEAGVHLSQYSGQKGLNSIEPLFRATYTPTQSFSILLGWLNGANHHKLISPLYQWERMYTQPLEYGVQFLIDKPAFKLDTWIDWEKYIELNDPFQEALTFGTSSKVKLIGTEGFTLWLPVQISVKHQGGQITTNGDPLVTIANFATGFNAAITNQDAFVKKLLFDVYAVSYSDLSPQKKQAFRNGYGVYPSVSAIISDFNFMLGYWFGHKYIAPKGEPLLLSASRTDVGVIYPNRYVLNFKTLYQKRIFKDISFGAYFESFYDINRSLFDYAYGIDMAVSSDFIFFRKK